MFAHYVETHRNQVALVLAAIALTGAFFAARGVTLQEVLAALR